MRAQLYTTVMCILLAGPKLQAQNWSSGSAGAIYYNGGNVGIGTASPANAFSVHVGTNMNFGVEAYAGSLAFNAFNDTDTAQVPLALYASQFSFLTGNVGIGTATPQALLDFGTSLQPQELLLYDAGTVRYGFGMASNELRMFGPGPGNPSRLAMLARPTAVLGRNR